MRRCVTMLLAAGCVLLVLLSGCGRTVPPYLRHPAPTVPTEGTMTTVATHVPESERFILHEKNEMYELYYTEGFRETYYRVWDAKGNLLDTVYVDDAVELREVGDLLMAEHGTGTGSTRRFYDCWQGKISPWYGNLLDYTSNTIAMDIGGGNVLVRPVFDGAGALYLSMPQLATKGGNWMYTHMLRSLELSENAVSVTYSYFPNADVTAQEMWVTEEIPLDWARAAIKVKPVMDAARFEGTIAALREALFADAEEAASARLDAVAMTEGVNACIIVQWSRAVDETHYSAVACFLVEADASAAYEAFEVTEGYWVWEEENRLASADTLY